MSSKEPRKDDLLWNVKEHYPDLVPGELLRVIQTPPDAASYPEYVWAVPVLRHGRYSGSGYCLRMDNVQLIELEAPDGAQADVPLAEGELPHAGRSEGGDAPPVPEPAQ